MTFDFKSWMNAIWMSLIEPADMAGKIIAMKFRSEAMWTALALVTVLNVLLLQLLQAVSPVPVLTEAQTFELSPFAYTAIVGAFLVLLVFMIVHAGRMIGGVGRLEGALVLIVWFQAMSLTLEVIQVVLIFVSPGIAALFGMISFVAVFWAFVNFVNVLHGFENLGKAAVVIVMALVGTALGTLVVMSMLGVTPPGGTV